MIKGVKTTIDHTVHAVRNGILLLPQWEFLCVGEYSQCTIAPIRKIFPQQCHFSRADAVNEAPADAGASCVRGLAKRGRARDCGARPRRGSPPFRIFPSEVSLRNVTASSAALCRRDLRVAQYRWWVLRTIVCRGGGLPGSLFPTPANP